MILFGFLEEMRTRKFASEIYWPLNFKRKSYSDSTFNNYVDQILPNSDPFPPQVDNWWQFIWYLLPFFMWPTRERSTDPSPCPRSYWMTPHLKRVIFNLNRNLVTILVLTSSRLTKTASTSSRRMIEFSGASANLWASRSSDIDLSDRLSTQIEYWSSPAKAVI